MNSIIETKEDAKEIIETIDCYAEDNWAEQAVISFPLKNELGEKEYIQVIRYDVHLWSIKINKVIAICRTFDDAIEFVWKNREVFNCSLINSNERTYG